MIKILFLTANPTNTSELRLSEEIREIKAKIRASQHRANFRIEQEEAVRTTDIIGHLRWHKPHIVHFSGHGSKEGEIILEDKNGNSTPVSPAALEELFRRLKFNIHCVVLNACYSKKQAIAISKAIDYVIGMSNSISDSAAISFATTFYQTLGFGSNIQEAFDDGCLQIKLDGLR